MCRNPLRLRVIRLKGGKRALDVDQLRTEEVRRRREVLDSRDELDQLIKAGWGNIPQPLIPRDWRNRKPPKSQRKARYPSPRALGKT